MIVGSLRQGLLSKAINGQKALAGKAELAILIAQLCLFAKI